jgi:WD40 repeat protein
MRILKSHEFPPTVLKFNPTSTLLISGSADNTVRLFAMPKEPGDNRAYYSHLTLYWLGLTIGPLLSLAKLTYTSLFVLFTLVIIYIALVLPYYRQGTL